MVSKYTRTLLDEVEIQAQVGFIFKPSSIDALLLLPSTGGANFHAKIQGKDGLR
jgi:hypothetical protein